MKMQLMVTLAVALMLGSTASQAAVVYNNFGPGDAFNTVAGWTSYINNAPTVPGMQFVAGSTASITGVDVAMNNGPQIVTFGLYANSGTNTLGALLEAFTVDVTGLPPSIYSGSLSGSTKLTAGALYWLALTDTGVKDVPWNWNSTGAMGAFTQHGGYFANETLSAFRITGTPVPAPGALALLGLGLVGIGYRRRKRAA